MRLSLGLQALLLPTIGYLTPQCASDPIVYTTLARRGFHDRRARIAGDKDANAGKNELF
jgi:hypothetical protein